MSNRIWHKGPPPHIGWWAASDSRNKDAWRWWDGGTWSYVAFSSYTPRIAACCALVPAFKHQVIEWRHNYPINARVPRTDPRIKP